MNFLGVDVRGLDVAAFFEAGRIVYLLAFGGWVVLVSRGAAKLAAWAAIPMALLFWWMTTYPLQRNYGLGDNTDRQRHLAWSSTAAAGNAPWESGVVDRAHLEPFWATVVSTLALREPANVSRLYPFLPALSIILIGASFLFVFTRAGPDEDDTSGESSWIRAMLVTFFVLVASSQPLDFTRTELGWVGKYFLLKPNHAAAFALVPLCIWMLARPLTWRRGAGAVVSLASLGWAFVIFWVLVAWGALVTLAGKALARRFGTAEWRVVAVLALAFVLVAPYYAYLRTHFPNAVSLTAGRAPAPAPTSPATPSSAEPPSEPRRSPWGEASPRGESVLFVATLGLGVNFYLGVYGMWAAWRRRDDFYRLWLGVGVGCYLAWGVNAVLYLTGRARGATHLFMMLALVMAVFAGLGLYRLVDRLVRLARRKGGWCERWASRERLTAAALLVLFPLTLPWWWDPERMDGHFRIAMTPVDADVVKLGDWLRANTGHRDIVCTGRDALIWIPALSGRRSLPHWTRGGGRQSFRDECAIAYPGVEIAPVAAELVGVTHVVIDPSMRDALPAGHMDRNPFVERVFDSGVFEVYRLVP